MEKKVELLDLVESIGFVMINTSWRLKDELRKAFEAKGYDITLDQFAVLIRLWIEDGLSQTELSARTLKTKSNITRILDSMAKKNLIIRETSSEDRRKFSIYLTETGKDIKDSLIPVAIQMNNKIFNNISTEDKNNLTRILKIISNNLG